MKSFSLSEVVNLKNDYLKIDKKLFKSRLIVGTGKYKSLPETAKAIKASGAEIVTVAVRRVNISDKKTVVNGLHKSKKNSLSSKYSRMF